MANAINGGMTDYLEDKLVDHVLRIASFTQPSALHLALFSDVPTDTGGTELTGSNYSRVDVSSNWESLTNGVGDNTAAITFPTPSGSWSRAKGWKLFDAGSSGNGLFWGELISYPKIIESIDTGTETITITGHGFTNNTRVMVKTHPEGSTLPGGLSSSTEYYVVGAATDTLQLSLTEGGAAVNITSGGTGINRIWKCWYQTADPTSPVQVPAATLTITMD